MDAQDVKSLYRLRVWSYDMEHDVPEIMFHAFNDDDAKRQASIICKAYPAYLLMHLQRQSWDTVEEFTAEPVGRIT